MSRKINVETALKLVRKYQAKIEDVYARLDPENESAKPNRKNKAGAKPSKKTVKRVEKKPAKKSAAASKPNAKNSAKNQAKTSVKKKAKTSSKKITKRNSHIILDGE